MRRTEALALAILLVGADWAGAGGPANAQLACARRNPSLVEYTFDMNVALRMRHFPWFRFSIAGNGHYVRGQAHIVRFTKMPVFARGFHQIDLSPLDPCMWPNSYVASLDGTRGGMTTFLLRPKRVDPQDKNPMVEALVTLDAEDSTREVTLHYARGSITLALTPAAVGEYRLPSNADVTIDMPGQSLSAHADLSDYVITRQTADVGTSAGPPFP
jgi:hypothetical protein